MVEFFGQSFLKGRIRCTAPNRGWPLSPRKYTIKKLKQGKQITLIGFYDTISMSLHFGFKIRRYRKKWYMTFIHAAVSDYTTIPISDYKGIINVLKATKFARLRKF